MTEFVDYWQCGLAFDETDPFDIAATLGPSTLRDLYSLSGDRLERFARLCSWDAQEEKLGGSTGSWSRLKTRSRRLTTQAP